MSLIRYSKSPTTRPDGTKGEPRGELTHIANLVFPIGLLIIALRFILLSILALSGHKSVDPEAHMELGTGHTDDDKTREAAL